MLAEYLINTFGKLNKIRNVCKGAIQIIRDTLGGGGVQQSVT